MPSWIRYLALAAFVVVGSAFAEAVRPGGTAAEGVLIGCIIAPIGIALKVWRDR